MQAQIVPPEPAAPLPDVEPPITDPLPPGQQVPVRDPSPHRASRVSFSCLVRLFARALTAQIGGELTALAFEFTQTGIDDRRVDKLRRRCIA